MSTTAPDHTNHSRTDPAQQNCAPGVDSSRPADAVQPVGVAPSGDCCSLRTGPIADSDAQRLAARLKALSDPTRLRLFSLIAAQGCEDVCACDTPAELDVTQPTVSHHLKKLVEAGLLEREQRGKWAYYSVVRETVEELRDFLVIG